MRITINLRWDEQMALAKATINERRDARQQAAVFVREAGEP